MYENHVCAFFCINHFIIDSQSFYMRVYKWDNKDITSCNASECRMPTGIKLATDRAMALGPKTTLKFPQSTQEIDLLQ